MELYLQGKIEALRQKTFPSAHQSNTNTTLTGMGSNPFFAVRHRLSHSTTSIGCVAVMSAQL
jgi:hypothetical protein